MSTANAQLLALLRWHLAAIRKHSKHLFRLVHPVLSGTETNLSTEQTRVCDHLDATIQHLSLECVDLIAELRLGRGDLTSDQQSQLQKMETTFDHLNDTWRQHMSAVHEVWVEKKPPN